MIDAEQYLSCDRLIARSTVAGFRFLPVTVKWKWIFVNTFGSSLARSAFSVTEQPAISWRLFFRIITTSYAVQPLVPSRTISIGRGARLRPSPSGAPSIVTRWPLPVSAANAIPSCPTQLTLHSMLCSTALRLYRKRIVARCLRVRPKGLPPELMPDDRLRVAVRHVPPIRECPGGFRGFTLDDVCLGSRLKWYLPLILKGIQRFSLRGRVCHIVKSNFTIQMFLRRTRGPHIIEPIGFSSSSTSAVSSTSSFGGLNPNRSFGFFFARVAVIGNASFRAMGQGKWP